MESVEGDFAIRMNTLAKYVVSTTMDRADWNNSTIIQGNVPEEVAKLKQQPGKDILMYGFGPVARTLLQHNHLDEVRFWVHPILVDGGNLGDLLIGDGGRAGLQLVDTKALSSGVVILSYRSAAE